MKAMHPTVLAAAQGVLPDWTVAGRARRAHMDRVSRLLADWSVDLGFSKKKRARWVAAGLLHDALRDERPAVLRRTLPKEFRTLPDAVLHGPAAAERLRAEGVKDETLLLAVAFHTLGHPDFRRLGKALLCADYLEPGRTSDRVRRDRMLRSMPGDLEAVAHEIVRIRVQTWNRRGQELSRWTSAFWQLLEGRAR